MDKLFPGSAHVPYSSWEFDSSCIVFETNNFLVNKISSTFTPVVFQMKSLYNAV